MIIADKVYLNFEYVEPIYQEILSAHTYANPVFKSLKRNGYSTRGVPTTIYNYYWKVIDNKKYLVVPRGSLPKIRELLLKNKLITRFSDKRILKDSIDISFTMPNGHELSNPQKDVLEVFTKNHGGLIQAGCGSGKTVACLKFLSDTKQPTLIVVHTSQLQKQWIAEIKEKCFGSFKLGRLDGAKKQMGDVVVAVVNSLNKQCKLDTPEPDYSYLDNFGMIVVDEVHHASSNIFKTIVDNSKSYYRVGVTGTVNRKDNMEMLVFDSFGPILRDIKENEVKERITDFDYKVIDTELVYEVAPRKHFIREYGKSYVNIDYDDAVNAFIENKDRNNLILSEVSKDIEAGHKVLVLTYRTDHAHLLFDALSKKYHGYLLIGENSKKFNTKAVKEDQMLQFIVANRAIAGEGMDIPQLSCLHLTLPTTNLPKLKQYLGRIRRFFKGKKFPIVKDYRDPYVTCLSVKASGEKEQMNIFSISALTRIKFYKKLKAEYNKNPGDNSNEHKGCN